MNRANLNRRTFLQLTGGLAVTALAAACATPSTTEPQSVSVSADPQQGGTLRIAMPDGLTSLDPSVFLSTTDIVYGFMTYETLTRRNEGETGAPLSPQLAESWEMSEDGLTYTVYLRQGVTFHHGTPLTATDVEYTLQRALDPALGLSIQSVLSVLDRVEIVDEYTLNFHLTSPSVTLPFILGSPGLQILPHDRTDEERNTAPSGTGPFRFVESVSGERAVFKRNEEYWHAELPYVDEVQLLTIPETATQIASLTSGTIDMIAQVGIENLAALESAEGIQIWESLQGTSHLFVMNVAAAPFDDLRVRQAFKHAVNRNALQQVVLLGRGAIMNDQPVAPGSTLWADVDPLPYDVAQAKALLRDAGYEDGLEVTLSVAEVAPRIIDAAVVLQEMVQEAGITINLNRIPMANYWTEHYMQSPFFVSYWPSVSEPDIQLSWAYVSDGTFNESGWSDPRVDELVVAARGERDMAKRQEQTAEIQQVISQEGAVIIPYLAPMLMATRTNVRGLIPSTFLDVQLIWLASEA